ncbi:MAG: efflux RND transporter permease subunit, partial [Candidatus Eremiobacteraeota bacterium]|nr:efflux RND transporter permease subunit [Candidatus Eremiobacteraeota bacterium]
MWLTRAFIERPTLALVFVVLVTIAGIMALRSLVVQQFPNVENPVVRVGVSYSGASTTEMRDSIVIPIENQLAGTPDMQTLDSTVESGAASISATFSLQSDPNTDLVYVQRAVQAAQRQLPTDLLSPSVNMGNPAETVVATIGVSSKSLDPSTLSLLVTGVLVPELEQIPGVSNVNANGTVTPAYEVTVDPSRLSAAGLTLTDVVNSIKSNNVHAPGGIVYEPQRETTLDVRADITDAASIADLLIQAAPALSGVSATAQAAPGQVNAWTTVAPIRRIGDVATVVTGNEPQRTFATVNGAPSLFLQVQKTADASEVTAADNVVAALPKYRARFPQLTFRVINVQATYTKQQLDSVMRTLFEGIVFVAIVMLFFLQSWRSSIVVLIAIPTSLAVTLFAMKILNFTLDTVSLLAMTLSIGILIDDSTVVIENIDRHHEMGEAPERAAVNGRTE